MASISKAQLGCKQKAFSRPGVIVIKLFSFITDDKAQ